jgi:DNA gyrase/topoisomerase IV subunit A
MLDELFEDEAKPVKSEVKIIRSGTSVKSLINVDYRGYAMYVLEHRAIPSVIDGFKTSQRKLFYAMQKNGGKKIKLAELGGSLSSYGYAHGESSAQAAAVNMSQEWANNIAPFIGHGNFGTRLIQEAAAPRYIYATMNPLAEKIFNDNDVLNKNEDPDDVEPHHYLPIIPWVLLNGIKGIAVGFAVDILPRTPKALIQACREYISTGSIKIDLVPSFPSFRGEVRKIEDGKYMSVGVIEKGLRNSYVISDLPWGHDRESYFNHLVAMQEDKKINSFEDHCDKTGFNFVVKMDPEQRTKAEVDLIKYFKLSKIHTENYTTLDENGKLRVFNHVNEIIAYFCNYRIKKKKEQLDFNVQKIQDDLDFLLAKQLFIDRVLISGVREVSTWKLDVFKSWILEIVKKKDFVDSLSKTPVYKFTYDEIQALEDEISKKTILLEEAKQQVSDKVLVAEMISLKV